MLIISRKMGESFYIGENICVTVEEIKGDRVKISIDAPRSIPVLRKELLDAQNANREALSSSVSNIGELNLRLRKPNGE